jgi:hypothetical protein
MIETITLVSKPYGSRTSEQEARRYAGAAVICNDCRMAAQRLDQRVRGPLEYLDRNIGQVTKVESTGRKLCCTRGLQVVT